MSVGSYFPILYQRADFFFFLKFVEFSLEAQDRLRDLLMYTGGSGLCPELSLS